MNFLVDAQLPRRLAEQLRAAGHDALHTLDLPAGNRTTDEEINTVAERDSRVVITKDADFVNSFLLIRRPPKLLLVSTGNIGNQELEALFLRELARLSAALLTSLERASRYVRSNATVISSSGKCSESLTPPLSTYNLTAAIRTTAIILRCHAPSSPSAWTKR